MSQTNSPSKTQHLQSQIDTAKNETITDQGNNPQDLLNLTFDASFISIQHDFPNFSDFLLEKKQHQITWQILNNIKAFEQVDIQKIIIRRKKIKETNQQLQKIYQDNNSQNLQQKLFESLNTKHIDFTDNQSTFIPLKDGEVLAIQLYYYLVILFENDNDSQNAQKLTNPVTFEKDQDYYSLLEKLEHQQKFIELSGQDDYEDLIIEKGIIFDFLKNILKLEQSKSDTPNDLDENSKQISNHVNSIFEAMDEIKNQEIKFYIKDILFKAVQQLGLSEYFARVFQKLDDPQKNVRDLNPDEFKDQFFNELFNKVKSSEMASKYSKYLQKADYFLQLFLNMTQWIEQIYPNTQIDILSLVNKITDEIHKFIKPYKGYSFDKNLSLKSLENDFQQLYELEINLNDLYQNNKDSLIIFSIMQDISQASIPALNIQVPKTLNEQQKTYLQKIVQKLPRLPKNYTILDCKTIDGNKDLSDKIHELLKDYQLDEPINSEKLIQILFDLVKQQQNFSTLVSQINKIQNQVKLTQFILQVYLLEHADYDLKVLLCRDFSQFMPMPLAFYNPWSQSQSKNLEILDPIYYIYEKSQLLIQFKLPKFEQPCLVENNFKGCTHLLNNLFGRDFSKNQDNSLINNGLLEIQFDQDCANIEHMTIIDVHGFPNFHFLKQLFPLADVLIIHQYQDYQQEFLKNLLEEISNTEKTLKTVIIIKHNSNNQDLVSVEWKLNQRENLKIFVIKTRKLFIPEGNVIDDLINELHKILDSFYNFQSENYKKDPRQRLSSKQEFQNLLKNNSQDQHNIYQNSHDTFSEILEQIMQENNLKGKNFLPMLNFLQEKKSIEEKIFDEYCPETEKTDGEDKLTLIQQNMEKQEASQLTKLISNSINKNQCFKLLPFLSSVIKDYLEAKNKVLNKKKEALQEELQTWQIKSNQNKELEIQLQKQIDEIVNQTENNYFSIELIFSEIQFLAQYSKQSSITQEDYNQLIKQNDKNGQPQQLIDGQSLICNSDSLKQLEDQIKNNENLFVLSIFGPQSSGKSLMLNKIFGTSFLSASGRCTKGVYYSIIRYKNEETVKKILVLDTEGIQSIEGKDAVFDKRLIYYAIGVSHAVLICNQKEMNAYMKEALKLVAEAISETKTTIVKDPSIYIVLNMCQNVDDDNILQGVNLVKDELQEMALKQNEIQDESQKNWGNSMIKIKGQNILKLGQAFNKIHFGPNNFKEVHKPNFKFSKATNELQQILTKNQFQRIEKEETTKLDFTEQVVILQEFWQFSKTSRTLCDYPNLHHKRLDKSLMNYINQKIKEKYSEDVWNSQYKQQVIDKCDEVSQQNENFNEVNIDNVIFMEIKEFIQQMLQIDETLLQEYQQWCKDQKIDQNLMAKRIQFFNKAKDQAITRAFTFCQKRLQEFVGDKTKLVGQNLIREKAKQLLSQNKTQFTIEQSKKEFNQFWPQVKSKVKDLLKDHQQISKETTQQVIFQFQYNLNQILKEEEKKLLNQAKILPEKEWQHEIMQYYFQKVLLYSGNKYGLPKIQNILNFQTETQEYLDNSKTQLFESKIIYKRIKWWDLLSRNLDLDQIVEKIKKPVKNIVKSGWQNQIRKQTINQFQFFNSENKINQFLDQFKNECQNLGFQFKLDQKEFLIQMKIQEEKGSQKVSNSIRQIFQIVGNFDCLEDLDLFRQHRWKFQLHNSKFFQHLHFFTYNFISQENEIQETQEGEKIILCNTEINISKQMKKQMYDNKNQEFSFDHQRLENYLSFMIDNQRQTNLTDQQASQAYFFRIIKWKEIFFQIQEIIIFRFHNAKQEKQENSINNLTEFLDKNPKKISELGQLDQEHASSIVLDIRSLIIKINEELKSVRMEISDIGETFIFLVAQIYTQQLVEKLEILKQNEVLDAVEETKANQEEWFVANLTNNNSEQDRVNGKTTAMEINKYFIEKSNFEAIEYFQQEMNVSKEKFKRQNYLEMLSNDVLALTFIDNESLDDQQTYIQSAKELINYYSQPFDFLKKKMDDKIKEVQDQVLPLSINYQMAQYNKRKESLINYFLKFKQTLKEVTKSSDLFVLDQKQVDKFQEKFKDQRHIKYNELQKFAITNYLRQLFQDKWNNQEENSVDGWKFIPKAKLPLSASLQDIFYHEQTCKKLASIINEVNEISDLLEFIEAFIETLEKSSPPEQLNSGQLMGQKYHDFRKDFIGCFHVCPMCRKQCDLIHKEGELLKHDFYKGQCHQFQGFGGNKSKINNQAITYSCNDLKDEQFITVSGRKQKWIDFKKDFKDWQFNQKVSEEQINDLRAKQVRIWNYIGKDLCKHYSENTKLNVQFVPASDKLEKFIGQVHLIFMLDASGSMQGVRWESLIKSISDFFQRIESNELLKESCKITCITFSDEAQINFEIKNPSKSLISQIKFIGKGTDFSDPFEKAYKIFDKFHKNFDKTVLYFLTDGEASKPDNAIKKFQQNKSMDEKLQFYANGYGHDSSFLSNIAIEMKGQSKTVLTEQDLDNCFEEIIGNVFGNIGTN